MKICTNHKGRLKSKGIKILAKALGVNIKRAKQCAKKTDDIIAEIRQHKWLWEIEEDKNGGFNCRVEGYQSRSWYSPANALSLCVVEKFRYDKKRAE